MDVSALAGVSAAHLSRIESADRWPSLPVLHSLAGVYGVDASSLLEPRVPDAVSLHVASATWKGAESTGAGVMVSKSFELVYTRDSRTNPERPRRAVGADDGPGSPEELIGMAFAGCFSMSLARRLEAAGFEPNRIETQAEVHLALPAQENGISKIELSCRVEADGLDGTSLVEMADATRRSCVVARALASVPTTVETELLTCKGPADSRDRRPRREA
jgi:osmotically inducible protein OsmC